MLIAEVGYLTERLATCPLSRTMLDEISFGWQDRLCICPRVMHALGPLAAFLHDGKLFLLLPHILRCAVGQVAS